VLRLGYEIEAPAFDSLLEEKCFHFPKCPVGLWDLNSLLVNGCSSTLLSVKRSGRDVTRSSPSSANVKNKRTPHCMERDRPNLFFKKAPGLQKTTKLHSTIQKRISSSLNLKM
jgi:hypothetical protein